MGMDTPVLCWHPKIRQIAPNYYYYYFCLMAVFFRWTWVSQLPHCPPPPTVLEKNFWRLEKAFLQYVCPTCHQTIIVDALTTTPTTILRPFFRDHQGQPVPEENFWTLWCKGRLTEADIPTIWLDATPSGLTSAHLTIPPFFYRPDGLPPAQPTKRWRQKHLMIHKALTITSGQASSFLHPSLDSW